ncbi:MAG: hypothetical protein NVS9B12_04490 [Vulcanimicrobiaceae bacterium]
MAARTRTAATTGLLVGLLLASLYLFANKPSGSFGFDSVLPNGRPDLQITAIEPGGAAQRAGLRIGDIVTVPGKSFGDRGTFFLFENGPLVAQGDVIRVVAHRADALIPMRLVALANPATPTYEAVYFCVLAVPMLLLGWFILWKKAESTDAMALGGMLMLFGIWIAAPDRTGPPLTRFILNELVATMAVIVAVAFAAVFFARYPEGRGLKRSRLRRALLAVAIGASLLELGSMPLSYVGPAYMGNIPWLFLPTTVLVVTPILAAFLCLLDAYRNGDATEQMRLRWVGGSYFLGFTGPILIPPVSLLLGPRFTVLHQVLLESTLFILAFGLTYAVLRRKVVDVTFILNRALVFSTVSAIVVALFIGIEWLAGIAFINVSRATSFFLEAGIAVFIGFSLRPIHQRVDNFIDRAFFAKRHAAERALHHLATEVSFIRDRASLLLRVQNDLKEHLETAFVSIYYRDDAQRDFLLAAATQDAPEFIDADDDAVVALAVHEQPVDLHGRRTAIPGELAIPLVIRKTLVGILVLGGRESEEAYAPDEIESLQFLANNLAPALAARGALNGTASGDWVLKEILAELRLQREDLRALSARFSNPDG